MRRRCVSCELTCRRALCLVTIVIVAVALLCYLTRVDLTEIRRISFEEVSHYRISISGINGDFCTVYAHYVERKRSGLRIVWLARLSTSAPSTRWEGTSPSLSALAIRWDGLASQTSLHKTIITQMKGWCPLQVVAWKNQPVKKV